MGAAAVGCSMSLVASGEDKMHASIVQALEVPFDHVQLDARLLSSAQERVNLAAKVISAEDIEHRAQQQNKWFREHADELGLELDESMIDNGLADGDNKSRSQLREAQIAKARLAELLAQPMFTQRFGKFLSTYNAVEQKVAMAPIVPIGTSKARKRRRRR
jgi:hypothetical protein